MFDKPAVYLKKAIIHKKRNYKISKTNRYVSDIWIKRVRPENHENFMKS